jgi:hypothetical protein
MPQCRPRCSTRSILTGDLVASFLHQDIQDYAVRIHRSSKIIGLAVHLDEYLVEVPCPFEMWAAAKNLSGNGRPELVASAVDAFVGDDDASFEHQLFNAPVAQRKVVVEAHT